MPPDETDPETLDALLAQARWPAPPASDRADLAATWTALARAHQRRTRAAFATAAALVPCALLAVVILGRSPDDRRHTRPAPVATALATSPDYALPARPISRRETDPCHILPVYPNGW